MIITPQTLASRERFAALDGVRGVAALIVVVHHALLAIPVLAAVYLVPAVRSTGPAAWLVYSPLHLAWDGGLAVYIFFILSGFVLTLPATTGTIHWRSYYPSRLLRLYIPTCCAVLFSAVLALSVARTVTPTASWWVNSHADTITIHGIIRNAALLGGTDSLNSALWTLRWEVFFSILLPVYVIFARRGSRWWPVKIAGCFTVIIVGTQTGALQGALGYLPIFAIGSVLACSRDEIGHLAGALPHRVRRPLWAALIVLALVLGMTRWLLQAVGLENAAATDTAMATDVACGLLLILMALYFAPAKSFFTSRPARWLGSRSFSLYLIHEPIAVSIALLLGPRYADLTVMVTVPLALILSDVFFRLIERPSHRLSRWVGSRARGGAGPFASVNVAADASGAALSDERLTYESTLEAAQATLTPQFDCLTQGSMPPRRSVSPDRRGVQRSEVRPSSPAADGQGVDQGDANENSPE